MIERNLQLFGLALLGVVLTLFLTVVAPTPIVCGPIGRNVRLPWAKTGAVIAGSERDLEIVVRSDGLIIVGVHVVTAGRLQPALQSLTADPDRHVLVSADGDVSYAVVEDVLGAIRDAGFERLSLVTYRGSRLEAWQRGGDV